MGCVVRNGFCAEDYCTAGPTVPVTDDDDGSDDPSVPSGHSGLCPALDTVGPTTLHKWNRLDFNYSYNNTAASDNTSLHIKGQVSIPAIPSQELSTH